MLCTLANTVANICWFSKRQAAVVCMCKLKFVWKKAYLPKITWPLDCRCRNNTVLCETVWDERCKMSRQWIYLEWTPKKEWSDEAKQRQRQRQQQNTNVYVNKEQLVALNLLFNRIINSFINSRHCTAHKCIQKKIQTNQKWAAFIRIRGEQT